jgi:hypothetical protein
VNASALFTAVGAVVIACFVVWLYRRDSPSTPAMTIQERRRAALETEAEAKAKKRLKDAARKLSQSLDRPLTLDRDGALWEFMQACDSYERFKFLAARALRADVYKLLMSRGVNMEDVDRIERQATRVLEAGPSSGGTGGR